MRAELPWSADVVIIGGGVIGSGIAREISRYDVKCLLVEKMSDVAEGTSKANNGIIHAGYAADHGTLKARLNVRGAKLYEDWTQALGVPYRKIGSLVVALNEIELRQLGAELVNGQRNGVVSLEIINQNKLRQMEPKINPEALAALYAPTAAVASPYELTIALAENAIANGVQVALETEVVDLQRKNSGWLVVTNNGETTAKLVINAAGLYADRISQMAGAESFFIRPRKGEYYLLDKTAGMMARHVLFPVASPVSKGITITPTVDGNLLLGPTADYADSKDDLATTSVGLQKALEGARKLIPEIPIQKTITQYAGLRATLDSEDFYIASSPVTPGLIHVAGIQSPGLASAPAIAKEVVLMAISYLAEQSCKIRLREEFNPIRKKLPRFKDLSPQEQEALIRQDPDWGQVICRCETVTKREVLDAIRGPLGARTLDAVKRRTRAGMGRCQGGFCTPRIAAILAAELGISQTELTKFGGQSRLFEGRVKGYAEPKL